MTVHAITTDSDLQDALGLFEVVYMVGGFGGDGATEGPTGEQCLALKTVAHIGSLKVKPVIQAIDAKDSAKRPNRQP